MAQPEAAPPPPSVAPHCRGLLWAWREGAERPLDEEAVEAALAAGPEGGGLWLHVDLVDARTRAFLLGLPAFPAAAREGLVDRIEAPFLEVTAGVLWGAVPDFLMEMEETPDPEHMGLLQFALAPGLLVTARRHPLRATYQSHHTPGMTPAERWEHILRALLAGLQRATGALSLRLDRLEDQLLRNQPAGRADLAELRRAILQLQRRLQPLALAYDEVGEAPPAWLAAAGHDAARMARRLLAMLQGLQALQERGRIAQDELASRSAEEANRRLLALSVLTAVLLPPSLVAGIFGMNTTDLPGTTNPGGFWWAISAIIATGLAALGGMALLLRR